MDRTDIAIVVNSTPKYFYLLDAFFGLLRRYGEAVKWPVYFATEVVNDPTVKVICKKYNVRILELAADEADFLESRLAAVSKLPSEIKYVLPLQEDFLLERPGVDEKALTNAFEILDADDQVQSIRLMPCPGSSAKEGFWGVWKKLLNDDLQFSYQATIWRRGLYTDFMRSLVRQGHEQYPELNGADWNKYCVSINPAETFPGPQMLKTLAPSGVHLCWPRKGVWANAVFWCPWPYRPTAVVKGELQPWATELIRREGFILINSLYNA
jgi:hypothetical protein